MFWRLVLAALSGAASVVVIVTGVSALGRGCDTRDPGLVGTMEVNEFQLPPQYSDIGDTILDVLREESLYAFWKRASNNYTPSALEMTYLARDVERAVKEQTARKLGYQDEYRALVVTVVRNVGRTMAEDVELLFPEPGVALVSRDGDSQVKTTTTRNVPIGGLKPQESATVRFWAQGLWFHAEDTKLVASNCTGRLHHTQRVSSTVAQVADVLRTMTSAWYFFIPMLAGLILSCIFLVQSLRRPSD